MRFKKLFPLLFLLLLAFLFLAAAPAEKGKKLPPGAQMSLEKIEKQDGKKHKKNPKKYTAEGNISKKKNEQAIWISTKTGFKITHICQLPAPEEPTPCPDTNPFDTPIEDMKSYFDDVNQRWIVESGPIKTDLVFQMDSHGKEIPNFYKLSFRRDGAAKDIDPHLAIHP